MIIKHVPTVSLFACCLFFTSSAQSLLNFGIGPTWPKGLRETERPTAWNASVEYAKLFDNIIGIGLDVDFSWNNVIDDTTYQDTGISGNIIFKTLKHKDNRLFMFPLSAFLMIDPIPKYKVHPVIKGQIGFNMMAKGQTMFDSSGREITIPKDQDEGGFYIGLLGKVSADAVFDIGEHAALFAGFELQWGTLKKRVEGTNNVYFEYNVLGPGIRMGMSFLF